MQPFSVYKLGDGTREDLGGLGQEDCSSSMQPFSVCN